MSRPQGASSTSGAHPVGDNDGHRRRGAWWWWLLALLVLAAIVVAIVLLVRHNSDDDTSAAAPAASASKPSTPLMTPSTVAPASSTSASSSTGSGVTSTPAVAASSCLEPTLTVAPAQVRPGERVVVTGRHFSGCRATTGTVVPTGVLDVRVGSAGAASVDTAIASARTDATGYFRVVFLAPARAAASTDGLRLTASSRDAGTTLRYRQTTTAAYVSTTAGGGMPTGVPAGSGGQAADTFRPIDAGRWGLVGLGSLLLVAGGGVTLRRRRGLN